MSWRKSWRSIEGTSPPPRKRCDPPACNCTAAAGGSASLPALSIYVGVGPHLAVRCTGLLQNAIGAVTGNSDASKARVALLAPADGQGASARQCEGTNLVARQNQQSEVSPMAIVAFVHSPPVIKSPSE
jgi:hypothetical protein